MIVTTAMIMKSPQQTDVTLFVSLVTESANLNESNYYNKLSKHVVREDLNIISTNESNLKCGTTFHLTELVLCDIFAGHPLS